MGSKIKAQTDENPKPLCVLEPGDCVGEETLLGGTGFSNCCSSKVVSIGAEFWVLPQQKQDAVEKMGLLEFLAAQREPNLQAIERKIDAAEYWQSVKKRTLQRVRGKTGLASEEVNMPVDPLPNPRGGAVLSWIERPMNV